ncbi:MAG: hypothetical protein FJ267_17870 [Planctomycetes bacterium]|nr:hypothetical protein [Planctomycetota bacterium]
MTTLSNSSTNSADSPESIPSRPKDREISGRFVVLSMVGLGLFLTSLLFIYFEYKTRTFRPLREAIGREFRHSRPNVEGGKLKGKGPNILRISMSIPFDPNVDATSSQSVLKRIAELTREHQKLEKFDQFEVNLIHFEPEKEAVTKSFSWPAAVAAGVDFIPDLETHDSK